VTRDDAEATARLSAVRLVSFIPPARDAVHVGLLTPDATHVVDLTPLGISDAFEALSQLDLLRRTAGAVIRGGARVSYEVRHVHLVAPVPLARSVVRGDGTSDVAFADPTTLHGPGSPLTRSAAAEARGGLAAVLGETIAARSAATDAALDAAMVGTLLVLGWGQPGPSSEPVLLPGAIGPFLAVPVRSPECVAVRWVSPLTPPVDADHSVQLKAPGRAEFRALARAALRTHTLRPGDLLTIFPVETVPVDASTIAAGTWVRVSAPGLGTLSLAVT
jgi:hypothetical protein